MGPESWESFLKGGLPGQRAAVLAVVPNPTDGCQADDGRLTDLSAPTRKRVPWRARNVASIHGESRTAHGVCDKVIPVAGPGQVAGIWPNTIRCAP